MQLQDLGLSGLGNLSLHMFCPYAYVFIYPKKFVVFSLSGFEIIYTSYGKYVDNKHLWITSWQKVIAALPCFK